MPDLVRKLLIYTTADGIVLQQVSRRDQKYTSSIIIKYVSNSIAQFCEDAKFGTSRGPVLEVYGIIGLVATSSASYLVSISQRQKVAQLWGKSVYVVKDVNITPLVSQSDALKAITKTLDALRDQEIIDEAEIPADFSTWQHNDDADSSPATDSYPENSLSRADLTRSSQRTASTNLHGPSNIAQDVIHKKGLYGRFAEQWFSRGRSNSGKQSSGFIGLGDNDISASPIVVPATLAPGLSSLRTTVDTPVSYNRGGRAQDKLSQNKEAEYMQTEKNDVNMQSKMVSTSKLLFGSNTFFFSYDLDITRSLAPQSASSSSIPLHKEVETQYFWNRHLSSAFIDAGFDEFVLPVMQGFVGQKAFSVGAMLSNVPEENLMAPLGSLKLGEASGIESQQAPTAHGESENSITKDFLLTLVSRRSVRRAGLRYLRRGIDEDGNTANAVETEQILSCPSWNVSDKVFSFLQTRGSIPLFFSQSPYSFKPIPIVHGSPESNQRAFKKHFMALSAIYGMVHAVSLLDAHGNEAKLGEYYQENAKILNSNGGINGRDVEFEWFDFHHVCKGMKFENVLQLVGHQVDYLRTCGWTVVQDNKILASQSGIIRTNCMDCLDRTNVVQSAFARYVLEEQLGQLSVSVNLDKDPSTTWFNVLWADNGDAISRAYAGTSALKGDYTRTRKRNIGGALNDLSLTLSRYYNNIFNDFFGQACIDYLLGNVTESVFEEFETNMMSADPAMDLRKLRQHAIDTCVKVVIEEHEDLIGGWAMSCPLEPNTIRTFPFEECLLLLTEAALYACKFEWNTEKVQSFERIPLGQVTNLRWGTYITSTLGPQHTDEKHNIGLVIRYRPTGKAIVRVNTRSLQNEEDSSSTAQGESKTGDLRFLAFKALQNRSSVVENKLPEPLAQTEIELIKHICDEIQRASARISQEHEADSRTEIKVEETAIMSLDEARRSTGYLEHIGYSLKKLVWG